MLGENELVKLFPDFKDLVQPSGIDLALDKIYIQESEGSLIDNEKNLPEIKELEGPVYTLKPHTAYLASIDRKIKIPKGYSSISAKIHITEVFCLSSDSCWRPWFFRNFNVYDL